MIQTAVEQSLQLVLFDGWVSSRRKGMKKWPTTRKMENQYQLPVFL
jgi:hypothetical protein